MDETAEMVKRELAKISRDVTAGMSVNKEKVAELQARLLDVEQKTARGGGGLPSDFGGSASRLAALTAAWDEGMSHGLDDLKASKRNSAVTLELPAKFFAATSTPDGGLGTDRPAGIFGQAMRRLLIRDLLPNIDVTGSTVPYVAASFTNAAAPVSEGTLKPESGLSAELMQSKVVTIATWLAASNQVLDDVTSLLAFIDMRLRYALATTVEGQLLFGSGVGQNLKGLMSYAVPFTDATVGRTPLDLIRRAIAALENQSFFATALVMNPLDLAELDLTKDAQGRYLLAVPAGDGTSRVWTVPTVSSAAMTSGSFLLGDLTQAGYVATRWQPRIEISNSHTDFFTRNLVAIRAEERLALVVHEPQALLRGVLT